MSRGSFIVSMKHRGQSMAEKAPTRLRVSSPDLGGNELDYASQAIASSWISSTGPWVERFEAEFAAMCGTRTAISIANGTAALHLAMLAHGVGPGDEVIVPSLTYIATANAVRYQGADPVFADVDPATWSLIADGRVGRNGKNAGNYRRSPLRPSRGHGCDPRHRHAPRPLRRRGRGRGRGCHIRDAPWAAFRPWRRSRSTATRS